MTSQPARPAGRDFAAVGDRELAALARYGDRAAFGELVQRATPGARRLLRRMGAQLANAEDVTQDALLAALRSIDSYRGDGSFASWVTRIAARLYVKRCRYDSRYAWMAELPDSTRVEDESGAPEAFLDLDEALTQLSPTERLCVALCHGAGFTHAEIAEHLHIPLGTAKSHVTRGLHKLRRHLLPDVPGNPEMEP